MSYWITFNICETISATFCWVTYDFLQLAIYFNLRHKKGLNGKQSLKCIRMGIIIFKMFIWGGMLSDIPTQMKSMNTVIPSFCVSVILGQN